MVGLVLVLVLVTVVAVAIIHPLVRPPLDPVVTTSGAVARRAELEERKAAIYGSIRDAGFDFRTGKLVEPDYRQEVESLKREAVEVLAALENVGDEVPRAPDALEARIAELRRGATGTRSAAAARFCTACGGAAAAEDRYCAACGEPLRGSS